MFKGSKGRCFSSPCRFNPFRFQSFQVWRISRNTRIIGKNGGKTPGMGNPLIIKPTSIQPYMMGIYWVWALLQTMLGKPLGWGKTP